VYSKFARSALLRALDRLTTCRRQEIAVVPHGVDTERFTPVDRRLARADACRLVGKSIEPDAFIVLNVSKNEPRKRLDLTIEAFARFARDTPPNVYLWLHTEPCTPGQNIFAAARAAGIETRLLVTTTASGQPALSDAQLNRIYNACDVGLNTAMGEAWGLASFEHAATGAPQVLPAIGAATELWHDAALLIPAHQAARVGSVFIGSAVAPAAVAHALDRLYSDSDYRAAMGRAALRNAHNPRYRWSAIADQWDALIADVDTGDQ
jgi:glycosyltransferase involved in cell wall biosynthesis